MKRLLISTTILTSLFLPQIAFGSDLEELKTAVEKWYQAYNSMDADTIIQMTHPDIIVCEALAPFPFPHSSLEEDKDSLKSWFSSLDSLNFRVFNPQYKVVGDTGIMWCYLGRRTVRKGIISDLYVRQTMTFVKSDGKWRVLMYHFSKFPLEVMK